MLESATRYNAPRTPGSTAKRPLVANSSPASSVLSYSLFQNQLDVGTALNSTYDTKQSSTHSDDVKPARSTSKPGTNQPASKLRVPTRTKLMSPRVKTSKLTQAARKPTTGVAAVGTPSTLTRSRSQSHLTPRSNATLTRSRTQTQLTPHTPRNKLPFIF
uniref:Uncharacterized protein n=4 Tax=Cacopsylla melanoneura TaxID=428564 RepID=A0A8D8UV03_9HEMI